MNQLKGKNIFIVEDDIVNRVTYQLVLLQEGAFVEFERWGRGAIQYLKANHQFRQYDLIILDLMLLQGENGYSIFEDIRNDPEFTHIPIIAISASDPMEAMEKCRALGFSGYISKPINERLFPKQLLQIMNGEEVWSIY